MGEASYELDPDRDARWRQLQGRPFASETHFLAQTIIVDQKNRNRDEKTPGRLRRIALAPKIIEVMPVPPEPEVQPYDDYRNHRKSYRKAQKSFGPEE